jgi:site-specific DNA-cytosine methylase
MVIGGGTNPHGPDRAEERSHRDITDEPSTTIATSPGGGAGNAGPWVVDADTQPEMKILNRNSGARPPQESDIDDVTPTVLGVSSADGGWDRLSLEVGVSTVATPEPDGMDFFDFLDGDTPAAPTNLAGSEPGRIDRPSPTVSATSEYKGSGPSANPEKMQRASDALYMATGRRRLTVQECALLQGFPADFPFYGNKTSKYKQVGNAVCPQVAEALARALPR